MKLVQIPKSSYSQYRSSAIFDGYKHDPQFLDNNTIAGYALVLSVEEFNRLEALVSELTEETIAAETLINANLSLAKRLALPRQTHRMLAKMANYNPAQHVRLMRFDFHPVEGGYAISEVNSDVPGGFAEASVLPAIAKNYLPSGDSYSFKSFGDILTRELAKKMPEGGRIAFVHCTSYSDDRQMVQYLGDKMDGMGYSSIYCAADHITFKNQQAFCILDGHEGKLDAVFRFTPLEWLIGLRRDWHGYFDTVTTSCNHPIAMFAQTKRFALIFDQLESHGAKLSAWRQLLPETTEVEAAVDGFIFKPACGRVGEGISIKDAVTNEEYQRILKDVKRKPRQYIAQKMFETTPLQGDGENFYVCLGGYSVEGKPAGFYARLARTRRIDSNAADIPVLVEGQI